MSDTTFHCVMCERMICHPTEEELEEQRRELAIWNMVRDEVMQRQGEGAASSPITPHDSSSMYTSIYSPNTTSPASSLSVPESHYVSAHSPEPEPEPDNSEDTDPTTQLKQELKEAKLRALYWQHQFTQDHAKHAEGWGQIKILEEKLITANEKLEAAETKIEGLEAELTALRAANRRRGTVGSLRALVGGPRDMERLASLMQERPSSR
ncbi:hypothetical protein FA13DRAFT_1809326 [Coprinellus micaceus]|uniref:Uncharacterized protein n=1 Tax=Coprinellus micaceus TaxID=71717 RepID=A0A4Y7TUX9_COPMI|nr:hypothetical protein FA13DRAFT_1809326 [Coprinellus micaceus]